MAFQQCLCIIPVHMYSYVHVNHTNLIVHYNIICYVHRSISVTSPAHDQMCLQYSRVQLQLRNLILVENKGPSEKNSRKDASNQRHLKSIQCHLCYSSRPEVMSYLYYYSYLLAIANLLIMVLVISVYSRYLYNE